MSVDFGNLQYWQRFASLCNQLIISEYPDAKVVEGSGGDEGIDTFVGDFGGEIHIFQHKFFRERLNSVRKRQIRHSLERAVEMHEPSRWTLCIPIELTLPEVGWFDELRKVCPETELDWWGEEKLKTLLAKHHSIQEAFFPEEERRLLQEIHERVVGEEEKPTFSVLTLSDQSTVFAKRYTANILIEGAYTKKNAREVIHAATEHVKRLRYYRNAMREQLWGNRDAHVVWLFIYRSIEDVEPVNWVCRTQWVDLGIDPEGRPPTLDYDEKVDDILVDWNERYDVLRDFYGARTADKATFLGRFDEIYRVGAPIIERATAVFQAFREGDLGEEKLIVEMQSLGREFESLLLAVGELGLPPFECRDLEHAFQNMMADAGNLFLYFSSEGLERWDEQARLFLAGRSLEGAVEELYRVGTFRKTLR